MIKLHFNGTTLEVHESDSSYRYRSLMAKSQLVLKFSLPEYVEIPIGAWCEFMGKRYTLPSPQNIKKHGKRNIDYTLTMVDDEDNLGNFKFRNPVDGRLKWSMCAKPKEFLQAIVDCLNKRDSGWSVGSYIDSTEKTIEFNHVYLDEALQDVAATFDTEYEVNGKVISLGKVEYFKDSPLHLSYGKGNGFMPGVGRSTLSDEKPIKILYVQGGEKNIDRSKYGSPTLLLPKSQSLEYEGRTYGTDAEGLYIQRTDKVSDAVKDDSLDCSEIYPSRVGTVSSVEVVDAGKNFYDFTDDSIPEALNFNDYIIEGETPVIRFQSGMLAGEKDFEFKYIHTDEEGNAVRRFELVPQEIDGQTMPNASFAPVAGDTYAVFGVMLPDSYICNDADKSGASWDMFREGVKYLYEHEEQKFTFHGELQALWAKRNWENVGGKLVVGGYVLFTDEQFATDGVLIRITGIKEYLTSPYSPTIEISNSVAGKSFSSTMRDIENTEIKIDETTKSIIQFTKRRFRDAQETMLMLEDAMLNFSGSINPITVQTMAALVGDESLQFRFVASKTSLKQVAYNITYDTEAKQLHCPHGFLQHMTLGINTIASEHKESEYKVWEMDEFVSGVLNEPKKKYYLYAKVSSTSTDTKGGFLLSDVAIEMNAVSGYYHLLTGILNSEYEGERSFVTLYGFTEILPGRITTDKIVSTDGETYFDLAGGEIGGKINFKKGSKGLKELEEWVAVDELLTKIQKDIESVDTNVKDLNKYVDGAFADGIITKAEADAIATYTNNVNNTKESALAEYEKLSESTFIEEDVKTALDEAKTDLVDAIDALIQSIETAIEDGKATSEESADVDEKFDAYNSAMSAYKAAVGEAHNSINATINANTVEAMKKIGEYSYLREALQEETTVAGGVVLSSFLALGRKLDGVFTAMSGMNGIFDDSKKGGGIAAWYGGAAVDKDDNPNGLTPATSLVRFDGSGYYANGAISWSGDDLSVSGNVYAKTLSVEPPTDYTLPEINGRYGMFYMDFVPCNSRTAIEKTYKASGTDKIVAVTGSSDYTVSSELSINNNDAVIFFSQYNKDSECDTWIAVVIPYTVYSNGDLSGYCDSALSETSDNPVKNWVITKELKRRIQNVSKLPDNPEDDVLYVLT